jgi:hypothetical protein
VGGKQAIAAQQVRDLILFHPNDPDDGDKLGLALGDIRHLYACSGCLDANPVLYLSSHRATQTVFFMVRISRKGAVHHLQGQGLGTGRRLARQVDNSAGAPS